MRRTNWNSQSPMPKNTDQNPYGCLFSMLQLFWHFWKRALAQTAFLWSLKVAEKQDSIKERFMLQLWEYPTSKSFRQISVWKFSLAPKLKRHCLSSHLIRTQFFLVLARTESCFLGVAHVIYYIKFWALCCLLSF